MSYEEMKKISFTPSNRFRYMNKIRLLWIGLILTLGFISYRHMQSLVPRLATPSPTSIILPILLQTVAPWSPSSSSSSTLLSTTKSSQPQYSLIVMDDRAPSFKLATTDGKKPNGNGDQAQMTVMQHLNLVERCKTDPSLIVVDVGAYLGDFGLYATACGCQAYLFEVQPDMVDFIRISIAENNFSTSRVHLINKAVNNLPSNSQISMNVGGTLTTSTNGSLRISTIRLDDIEWPAQSSILMLKVDVEGFELNVLRSAEKLFREKRIQHLIFEYTAWWTDRASQQDLIPFVEKTLDAKQLFALDRLGADVYGPLTRETLDQFHGDHVRRHLQTDIYATFVESNGNSTLRVHPYSSGSTFA